MSDAAEVYGRASVPLLTPAAAAAADESAHADGVPGRVLMENAGRAAAMIVHHLHPRGRILGVAGSGNNGGDLVVMLRVLHEWGRDTELVAVGSAAPDAALTHGIRIPTIDDDAEAAIAMARADVVVDGMLGTGSSGAARGRIADWIGRVNDAARAVVALDLPSGVDAGTGRVEGAAIRAHATICFGWPKVGLMLHPARGHCGHLYAVEIGFPPASARPDAWAITPDMVRMLLPRRSPTAHKSSAGRLLLVAGSDGMAGAAAMAGRAALRAGAGLIRIASVTANRQILQTLVPEATFIDASRLEAADLDPIHATVIGPGLGTSAAAEHTLRRTLELTGDRPVLLDADALNMLAGDAGALAAIAAERPLVITPHARELERLMGAGLDEILDDPAGAARAAAAAFGCVVLLKGQPSVIAAPDGGIYINTTGSSDVATAGMGDQLAGTTGALLASGMQPQAAAMAGLFLGGRAADIAAQGSALTPDDVSGALHSAFERPGATEPPFGLPFITFAQPPRH